MAFCQYNKKQNIVAGNVTKMNREATLFALKAMACDTPITDTVKMLQENFNIKISCGRLAQMKSQPSWGKYYEEFRHKYLANLGDTTGVFIANRRNRLEIVQTLLDQLLRSDCKLAIKDKVETCLKVLKQAQGEMQEVEKKIPGSTAQNVLQYIRQINMISDKEEKKEEKGEVIEGYETGAGEADKETDISQGLAASN